MLWTTRGGFLVTQECISTPLVPVYLAAICAYSTTWRRLILGVLAALPLFIALGIARLLVLALPDFAPSPLFFVHAFYQLLLGAVVVFVAALWRHGGRTAIGHATAGVLVGILFVYLLGPLYTRAVSYPDIAALDDPQGAIAFLPAFQIALYLALWVAAAFAAAGWRRFVAGLTILGLTQSAGLLALQTLARPRRSDGARARRPRLGSRSACLDLCRGDHQCPDASLKSSRFRPWPRPSRS